jgi:HAE1 family hydrophobic/amphiphilic exporter-1
MIRWAAGRPAVIWSLAAGLVIAGGVAFTKLPLATKTRVDTPRISVNARWTGASPELLETYITSPIEGAIQGIRGVRKLTSTSRESSASVQVELDPGIDMTFARLAILEQMEALRPELPREARQSLRVSQYVPEDLAEAPLLEINVTGPYTPGALSKITEDLVVPRFAALPGIAGYDVRGVAQNGAVISYDAVRLRQLGIDPAQLSTALSNARMIDVIGAERLGATERSVVLRDVPKAIEDLGRLPITGAGGKIHRLDEIATIRAEEDRRGNFYRLNGLTAVTLTLTREGGADAIKTVAAARAALAETQSSLPEGIQLKVASDSSEDLVKQLNDLMLRGAIAFGAVALVLLLTLRSFRSTGLVLGSATVAIAGTALGLYLLKIPANMLTLAGLAMGIGILVQNGLVVVERLQFAPDTPEGRAEAGRRISAAVIGSTLTTAVVLFPFLFLQGDARAAFTPFAAAFAIALFCSVATALVLIPAVGKGGMHKGGFGWLARGYDWSVRHSLKWRNATVALTIAAIAVLFWGGIKKVPRSSWGGWWGEQRETVSASVRFPRGSDAEQVERLVSELERVAVGREGVAIVRANGSPQGGQIVVEFTPEGGKTEMPWVIYEEMTQRAVLVGGAEGVSVQPPEGQGYYGGSGGGGGGSRRIKLLGYSFEGVKQLALDLKGRLEQIPRVRDVNINAASFWGGQQQVSIALTPDREALGQVGATARDFASSVGREVNSGDAGGQAIEFGDEELPVAVRALNVRERQFEQLREAYVSNPNRAPVQIDDVAEVGEVTGLAEIQREDQQYLRVVSYDFRGPQKLADRTHKAFMGSISVPKGYTVDDQRFEWDDDNSSKGLYLVFGIGVVLVLLSVALVFDSWWATLMVFLSLPMAIAGVAAAFWVTGTAFTREAAVGVILVVGLAVNQAILLIDSVLATRRRKGTKASALDVIHATRDRAGMIVLVTLTTIASLVPMAWGSESDTMFGAIALATAGGTVAGTIAALWLMPAVLVGTWKWRRGRRRKGGKGPKGPGLMRRLAGRFRRQPVLVGEA